MYTFDSSVFVSHTRPCTHTKKANKKRVKNLNSVIWKRSNMIKNEKKRYITVHSHAHRTHDQKCKIYIFSSQSV